MSQKIIPFKAQAYEDLKKKHNSTNLFVDPCFTANIKAICHSESFEINFKHHKVEWKRPNELCKNPEFEIDGFNRLDVNMGSIGNCWFIAGVAGICSHPILLSQVIPDKQNFKEYSGIFHFRFWQYGDWYDVVIDDLLPYSNYKNSLLFAHNKKQPNEFWLPLLEKAYAKLYGSYEALKGGYTNFGIMDMTGGILESIRPKSITENLYESYWNTFCKSHYKLSILSCSITDNSGKHELVRKDGLVTGHAFTITKLATVNYKGKPINLIRIRNPWGNETEWNGVFSDKSKEWDQVSENDKKRIDFKPDDDGEFWMTFDEFMKNWDLVDICHMSCDSYLEQLIKSENLNNLTWKKLTNNAWKCKTLHFKCEPHAVPIFLIKLEGSNTDKTLVCSLTQKDNHLTKDYVPKQTFKFTNYYTFNINSIKNFDIKRIKSVKLKKHDLSFVANAQCQTIRDFSTRLETKPGNYILLPKTTFGSCADCVSDLMLRIFSDEEIEVEKLDSKEHDLNEIKKSGNNANHIGLQSALEADETKSTNKPKNRCILI